MPQSAYKNKLSHFFDLLGQAIKGGEHDYTKGSLRGAIILLAIPMILELSFESIFAVVDIFFVSKLGSEAIQTVGLTESVITIVYSLAIGLSTAATAMVARRVGEKNPVAASHAGMQALIMSLIATVLISIPGFIFAPDILRLMGGTPEVVKQGAVFTRIMLGGSVVIILLFLINGIFRGAGNASIAMKSLILASVINIILCPALINGWGFLPELGLKGAAIATVIGRGAGVLYQCYFLLIKKNNTISFRKEHFIIDFPLMRSLVKIASPATLQFIIASGSWIVLAKLVADTGGLHASAGYQVAIRNVVFFILPAWGLSNAAATLVGQNLGAGQPDRAEKSVMLTTKYNAIFMTGVMLVFMLFAKPIISIFTAVPEDLSYGVQALQIIGTGYIFYGIGMVMMQALNGAGDTRTPTKINFVCFWLFQVPLALLLVKVADMGVKGAFVAIPVAETLVAIVAWYYFRQGKWKQVQV